MVFTDPDPLMALPVYFEKQMHTMLKKPGMKCHEKKAELEG